MYELGAAEAARRIRAGALSPSNLLAACLKRIDAIEPAVGAWVRLDRDAAARVAVQRDIEAREGRFMGALHGVPIALKDIFDAAGVPTTCGRARLGHADPGGGRAVGRGAARRGRGADGQARHHALRLPRSLGHPQSVESRAHARRLLQRPRRGGGRAHGAAGARLADGGLGAAPGRVLRRRRAQAHVRPDQRGGRARAGREPRPRGGLRAGGGGLRARPRGAGRGRSRAGRLRRRGDRAAGAPPGRARVVPGARDARDGQAPGSGRARARGRRRPAWRT